jgi:hypothetical protein
MAYTTVNKSSDFFNTKLYTGNGGSSTDSITGINFQPDWVWIKARNNTYNHNLYDSVRGLSSGAILSNSTDAQDSTQRISSFDSDGFTLPATNYTYVNASGTNYVAWNWKAGGTGVSNTDGTITSTVSASTTSGFSIVTYTGTGANATVGHGLGSAPSVVICKQLNATQQWINYHKAIGATKYLHLNASDASATSSTVWNDTDPTSSVFSVGTAVNCNGSGNTYIAYCFAPVRGFSSMGSYVGNGSATDAPFIYTGMKPSMVMVKCSSASTTDWIITDNKRGTFNPAGERLYPNLSASEDASGDYFNYFSNGFKFNGNVSLWNTSGATYIYMAFAESPIVSSNGIPAVAR